MIIYLLDQQKTEATKIFAKNGVSLWQPEDTALEGSAWNNININPLERVDALALEITQNDPQINYLLAQAILLQKNTLCFFKKSLPPRPLLMYLRKKNVPHCILTRSYIDKSLPEIIAKFVQTLKPTSQLNEIPNIKYTLRMTEVLENYLNWKAKQTGINKADFIRDNLKKMMEEDEEYRKI